MTQDTAAVRLTTFSHGAGCACKLPLAALERLMGTVGTGFDGGEAADDALLVGAVAGDALSDVYAMGGRPLMALNLTAWPNATLPLELLAEVLRGGAEVAGAAGCLVVGGHSIDDPEPKYGLAVVGRADPAKLLTVDRAQ